MSLDILLPMLPVHTPLIAPLFFRGAMKASRPTRLSHPGAYSAAGRGRPALRALSTLRGAPVFPRAIERNPQKQAPLSVDLYNVEKRIELLRLSCYHENTMRISF